MIIATSLMIVSFLAMMTLAYFRFPFFSERSDRFVENRYNNLRSFFRHWNWRTVQLLYHFILRKIEDLFLSIYRYARKKFDKPVSMVKGQGSIPAETSASSFYLKNIEEHKNDNRPK